MNGLKLETGEYIDRGGRGKIEREREKEREIERE